MRNFFYLLFVTAFLCSCSTITVSKVTDYSSIDNPINKGENFFTLNLSELGENSSTNSLMENEILEFIADDLNNKGFVRVPSVDSSDFIVTIKWQSTTEKTAGQNITYTTPSYDTSTTTGNGQIGATHISGTSSTTTYSTKENTLYIPPSTYHPESFVLSFLDTSKYKQRKNLERYRAESKFNSEQENPLTWAPEHIQNMLETFRKSMPGKTGYAGLAFNTESSPPTVYSIDSAGPSSKYSFLENMKIIEINGQKIKYRTQAHKIIKNSQPGTSLVLGVGKNDTVDQEVTIEIDKTPNYFQLEKPYF